MRVALISPLFESVPPRYYGGTERVIDWLARGLTQAGAKLTLFASGDSRTSGDLVPIVPEALRLSSSPTRDASAIHIKMLAEVASRAHEFDIIHNHHDFWMLPLGWMTETPFLSTLHGQLDLPDTTAPLDAFSKLPYVSISNSQRRPKPNLNWAGTVHHGIDIDRVAFYPESGKYLAFLGRISQVKRPDLAIQIAKLSGVPLKIAAKVEGGADTAYYEQVIKPQIDGKFIEFVGEISESEKSDFLGNALALVFPIDWPEPFGLVMVEALARGTPVLARPFGAVPEVLRDGLTGFISADATELANKVHELSTIQRLNCRGWVEKNFSLTRMTEDYLNVYRTLIDQHRPSKPYPLSRRRGTHRRRNLLYSIELASQRHSKVHVQR